MARCKYCKEKFDIDDARSRIDDIFGFGAYDAIGEDVCFECGSQLADDQTEESMCDACGNPDYPMCKDSCGIYND